MEYGGQSEHQALVLLPVRALIVVVTSGGMQFFTALKVLHISKSHSLIPSGKSSSVVCLRGPQSGGTVPFWLETCEAL